jgi:hypothetical protein
LGPSAVVERLSKAVIVTVAVIGVDVVEKRT